MRDVNQVLDEFVYCRMVFTVERIPAGPVEVWCDDGAPPHLVCTVPKGTVEVTWTEAWKHDEIRPLILQRAIAAAEKDR